jgi:hypothetical protein
MSHISGYDLVHTSGIDICRVSMGFGGYPEFWPILLELEFVHLWQHLFVQQMSDISEKT